MQRSTMPLTLALVTFALALLCGGYAYNTLLRTVPALVAVHDIGTGAEITPEMVRVVRIPAGGRPPSSLYGPGQITGMYAAVPLFAEQVVTARHVTSQAPARDAAAALAPGQRIVSVPVRSEHALAGAGRPGDLVDVVAAWPPSPDGKPGSVEVLMMDIKVIDLRNSAGLSTVASVGSDLAPESAVPASALLLVSPQQGRALVAAVEAKAAIYLWLTGHELT